MVQGQELEALRAATPYQRVVYCGDGANDLCPSLALASTDTVLARKVGCNRYLLPSFIVHGTDVDIVNPDVLNMDM